MTTDTEPMMHTDLPLPGRREGKVRDLYHGRTTDGTEAMILIATDRISAFDVVLPTGIPDKGRVLTRISAFWFHLIHDRLGDRLAHHLLSTNPADIEGLDEASGRLIEGRVMIGRKVKVLPVECIVRGYLAGSGWKEYQRRGTVCGVSLPAGLSQSERLPEPIFTPSTKAEEGHDENISFERAGEMIGEKRIAALRDWSLAIYNLGHDHAAERGIILADTKFEFGLPVGADGIPIENATPILIDEVLTPDSSRFWPAEEYRVGQDQPSFDKQYVRNYLQELVDGDRWDKQPPGPELPPGIVANTREKYAQAYRQLTGDESSF